MAHTITLSGTKAAMLISTDLGKMALAGRVSL
jgi:hypothetical protein